jgi:hypothetical protein
MEPHLATICKCSCRAHLLHQPTIRRCARWECTCAMFGPCHAFPPGTPQAFFHVSRQKNRLQATACSLTISLVKFFPSLINESCISPTIHLNHNYPPSFPVGYDYLGDKTRPTKPLFPRLKREILLGPGHFNKRVLPPYRFLIHVYTPHFNAIGLIIK